MQEIEITGKNIEAAIAEGIKKLNCSKDDVEIKILDEGTAGLFGLMGTKPAKVLLTLKEHSSVFERNQNQQFDCELACQNAEIYLKDIISMMNIDLKDIKTVCENNIININIATDNGSLLIGKGGQSLDALEYIVQLMLNSNPKTRGKINLDTENYRLKQQERLKALADKAAEYVTRTEKIYRFDPMPAKERKIIHMYLKDRGNFETFSEGSGIMRKVGVKLSREKKIAK